MTVRSIEDKISDDLSVFSRPTVKVGAFSYNAPDGTGGVHIPGEYYFYSGGSITNTTTLKLSTQQALVAEFSRQKKIEEYLRNQTTADVAYQIGVDRPAFNPAASGDKLYDESQDRLESVEQLAEDIEAEKAKEDRIKENNEEAAGNASFAFGGLIDAILAEGLDFLLEKVNDLLPSEFQLDLDVTSENGEVTFNNISVGDVSFDPNTGEVSYNGNFFDGLIQQGVDIINEILPDFLQIDLNGSIFSMGSIRINLYDIQINTTVELHGDISLSNVNGSIVLTIGGKEFNLTNIAIGGAQGAAKSFLKSGLDSLNREIGLGSDFVSIEFDQGSLLPKAKIGPLEIDLANGKIGINPSGLSGLLEDQLSIHVFSKLPGPLGAIAKAAWESLPIDDFLEDLFPQESAIEEVGANATLCVYPNGQPSTPPVCSSPAGVPPKIIDPNANTA